MSCLSFSRSICRNGVLSSCSIFTRKRCISVNFLRGGSRLNFQDFVNARILEIFHFPDVSLPLDPVLYVKLLDFLFDQSAPPHGQLQKMPFFRVQHSNRLRSFVLPSSSSSREFFIFHIPLPRKIECLPSGATLLHGNP